MNSVSFQEFPTFFAGDFSPENDIPSEFDSEVSDCESGITGSSSFSSSSESLSGHRRRRRIFSENLTVEVPDTERTYELIRRRFLAGVGDTAVITAVHRRNFSSGKSDNSISQARVQSFQLHAKALESKYGGPPTIKFCWYGGDKDNIQQILSHGFSYRDLQTNIHGAICLSPDDSPFQSVEDSGMDEDGLRHVLLCRVLLGRSELVQSGLDQSHSSSDKFDSGVDSYENPKKYIVWSTNMNTHILPEYVITFKIKPITPQLSPKGVDSKMKNTVKMPTSPWVSFPALISVLARYLAPDAISLIAKYHNNYKVKNITRAELIEKVRQIAGDKLLIAVIKSFKGSNNKEMKLPFGLSYRKN